MTGPDLLIDRCDGWLRLTLNRPDKLNALTRELIAALTQALRECADDPDIRAVLLTGAGRGFCSGQDLGRRDPDGDDWPPDLEASIGESYSPLVATLMTLPKPVVCAVNGVAAGAGANLALACDVVLAAEEARFIQSFVRVGLMPDAAGTWVLPRLVGAARARALCLTATPVGARQAEAWGMIWQALPAGELMAAAETMTCDLAQAPAPALGRIKQALLAAETHGLSEHLVLEARLQGELGRGADYAEGLRAFLSRRAPVFNAKP